MPKYIIADRTEPAALSGTEIAVLWTESLHAEGTPPLPMDALSRSVGAVSVFLVRVHGDGDRLRVLSRHARPGRGSSSRALGTDLVPVASHRARVGSTWWLAELDPGALDDRRCRMLDECGILDAACIVLGHGQGFVDLLECHFPARPDMADRAHLAEIGQALSFAWRRMPEQRLARRFALTPERVFPMARSVAAESPLSTGNPWRLTASELRICALMRDGFSAADIVAATGSAESTVRSHLRSIYAKAGVTGQLALIRRLMEDGGATAVVAARA